MKSHTFFFAGFILGWRCRSRMSSCARLRVYGHSFVQEMFLKFILWGIYNVLSDCLQGMLCYRASSFSSRLSSHISSPRNLFRILKSCCWPEIWHFILKLFGDLQNSFTASMKLFRSFKITYSFYRGRLLYVPASVKTGWLQSSCSKALSLSAKCCSIFF